MANSKGLKFLVTGALLIGSATGCGSQEEPFLNVRGGEEEVEEPPGVCCPEPPNINVPPDEELLDDGSAVDEGSAVEIETEGESEPPITDSTVTDSTAVEQPRPPVRNAGTMQDRPFLNVRGPGNDYSPR